jgi:hypothetical protein
MPSFAGSGKIRVSGPRLTREPAENTKYRMPSAELTEELLNSTSDFEVDARL